MSKTTAGFLLVACLVATPICILLTMEFKDSYDIGSDAVSTLLGYYGFAALSLAGIAGFFFGSMRFSRGAV